MMNIDDLKKESRAVVRMLIASNLPIENVTRVIQLYDNLASAISASVESISTADDTLRYTTAIARIQELLSIVPKNKLTKQ